MPKSLSSSIARVHCKLPCRWHRKVQAPEVLVSGQQTTYAFQHGPDCFGAQGKGPQLLLARNGRRRVSDRGGMCVHHEKCWRCIRFLNGCHS